MADGIELEFNSKGEWLEIDCKNKAVPSTFIPQAISKYMKANYNGHKTVKIERNRKGYELTLERLKKIFSVIGELSLIIVMMP